MPMAGIEKDYYILEEIEERWGLPRHDIAYLAENGLLKVSVRLYGIHIEYGSIEQTCTCRSKIGPVKRRHGAAVPE